jgi:hypothetical protein
VRPRLALVAALVCAGVSFAGCGDGPTVSPWTGTWTLDRERTATAVVEFGKAERARIREGMKGGGPFPGVERSAPKGPDPSDAEMIATARGWMEGMKADVELRADGTATADLYFGGTPVRYAGTWSAVGSGAEMKVVSRADGALQGRDTVPIRFVRDGEFLVLGGETDAKGALRRLDDINTAVPFRRMLLARK